MNTTQVYLTQYAALVKVAIEISELLSTPPYTKLEELEIHKAFLYESVGEEEFRTLLGLEN